MSWLEGETLGQRIARSDAFAALRPGLARRCGELLARIHAIDPATAQQRAGLESFTPEQCVRYWWQRYIALDTPQPMLDYCARWLLDHLPADYRMALVHGDFRNGNLLAAPDGVRAVLDWEMAHIGDPVRDLGWLSTHSWRFGVSDKPVGGFGDYADLLAGYEAAGGGRIDPAHLRFWEVFGSFCWAVCCMEMAAIYRSGRERNAERAAIGRRSSESQLDCANLILPGVAAFDELAPRQSRDELPALDELIGSVRDFLGDELLPATEGRLGFLTRVARNSLDIALRELQLGEAARAAELARLRALPNLDGTLPEMRAALAQRLREDEPLDQPGLADCLHHTLINRVRIDQPRYAGLRLP
jgi:thiamine kinase-like enzyme